MTLAIVVLFALPFVVFRIATLRYALVLQLLVYAFAFVVSRQLPDYDPYLGSVVLFVAQLALFSLLLATARPEEVRWSANRAAVVALLVYALMLPAMLRTVIDGDEPFYLLITESIVHDRDLDLANQYRTLAESATGRRDLQPQLGDPTGPHGEQYSRQEPFLPLLLVPGYLVARLQGSIAIIVLFGALLARSTVRLFEDEGIDDATTRAIFPLFAFAPPVVFYAARIWPEVPAAFFFVEAVRGVRQQRAQRWLPMLFGLTLLKLRFILVAVPLAIFAVKRRKQAAIAAIAIAIPIAIVWLVSGSATNVHSWRELVPFVPRASANGFFGLIVDGMSGIAFQAPFYLIGLLALARWRETPGAFRIGILSSLIYILYLIPRSEWHGGWAPPLRYILIFTPILALGAAAMWKYVNGGVIALIAIWTAGLLAHGATYPYRLFHIANGENAMGEWLSRMYRSDFSRLFPSFIRPNAAAIVASVVFVLLLGAFVFIDRLKVPSIVIPSILSLLLAAMFVAGQRPGRVVEFEDAHVEHRGGDLFPEEFAVARFLQRGGWIVRSGDSMSFLARGGTATLHYDSGYRSLVEIGGHVYELPPARDKRLSVVVPRGRVTLRCISGEVNLDSLTF